MRPSDTPIGETPKPAHSSFIATKIALPRIARRWIDRARLIERLGVPPAARVTLLHAGPGFGKTACLAQWQKKLLLADLRVAWFTAEPEDSDAATFIGYLAAALNACDGAIGGDVMELSRAGPAPGSATLVIRLLNQIAVAPEQYVLIVDDYHFVQSEAIDELVSELIAHAPQNLAVVIAARGMPKLRLGKLRADGEVLEVGPETLALTRAETVEIAQAFLDTDLSPRDVAQLQTLSEGWPAALQMILVALGSKKHLHQLVRGFSGDARVLRDYLAQEAFEGLPAETQQFLVRSSVLSRFCAELCEHVTGASNGAGAIADIEQRQLLILALDAQGHWFRYHALFAEFLRNQLRAREPGIERELHRKASEWFERNDLWMEAVSSALAAGEPQHALDIIDRCAMKLIERDEYVTLLDWFKKFPPDAISARPGLLLAQAWALALTMRHPEALTALSALRARPRAEAVRNLDVAGESALILGGMAILNDDFSDESFLQNPTRLSTNPWLRDVHKSLASYMLIMHRDYRAARDFPPCDTPLKIAYLKMLAGLAWWREGDGPKAERAFSEALEFSDEEFGAQSVAAALARAMAAQPAYERCNWREVRNELEPRLAVLEQAAPLEWLWAAYSTLASALAAGDNLEEARRVLVHGCDIAEQRRWCRLEAGLRFDLLALLPSSEWTSQEKRLRTLAESVNPETATGAETVFLCELGTGYEAALTRVGSQGTRRMEQAIERYGQDGSAPLRARALLMLARALCEAGQDKEASAALSRSLAIGKSLSLRQSYRMAGSSVARLMRAQLGQASDDSYLRELLGEARQPEAEEPAPQENKITVGSLSDRERDVLTLVGRGMSNKEISRALRIGPETVKWHLKNSFVKLDVASRMQAVNRARGLALIR